MTSLDKIRAQLWSVDQASVREVTLDGVRMLLFRPRTFVPAHRLDKDGYYAALCLCPASFEFFRKHKRVVSGMVGWIRRSQVRLHSASNEFFKSSLVGEVRASVAAQIKPAVPLGPPGAALATTSKTPSEARFEYKDARLTEPSKPLWTPPVSQTQVAVARDPVRVPPLEPVEPRVFLEQGLMSWTISTPGPIGSAAATRRPYPSSSGDPRPSFGPAHRSC